MKIVLRFFERLIDIEFGFFLLKDDALDFALGIGVFV